MLKVVAGAASGLRRPPGQSSEQLDGMLVLDGPDRIRVLLLTAGALALVVDLGVALAAAKPGLAVDTDGGRVDVLVSVWLDQGRTMTCISVSWSTTMVAAWVRLKAICEPLAYI